MVLIKCSNELANFTNSITEAEEMYWTWNCMFILFNKMVLKTIKDDLSALFTGETHSNPIFMENQSLVYQLLILA